MCYSHLTHNHINQSKTLTPQYHQSYQPLQSLISLYENQAEETYDNEEKVEREAYDYIFTCLKSHDRDYTMCGQIKESITMAEALKDATTGVDSAILPWYVYYIYINSTKLRVIIVNKYL